MPASLAAGFPLGFKEGWRPTIQLEHGNSFSPPRTPQAEASFRVPQGTQAQHGHDRRRGPQDSTEEWKDVYLGGGITLEYENCVTD